MMPTTLHSPFILMVSAHACFRPPLLTWHPLRICRPAKPSASAPAAAAAAAVAMAAAAAAAAVAPPGPSSGSELDPLAKAERTLVHCKASLERHRQQLEKHVLCVKGRLVILPLLLLPRYLPSAFPVLWPRGL